MAMDRGRASQKVQSADPDIRADVHDRTGIDGQSIVQPAEDLIDRKDVVMAVDGWRDHPGRGAQLTASRVVASTEEIASGEIEGVQHGLAHPQQSPVVLWFHGLPQHKTGRSPTEHRRSIPNVLAVQTPVSSQGLTVSRDAHLPDLRLPVPLHGGRRRALVSQPRQRLVAEGHEVTYLTLRQWDRGERRTSTRASACSRRTADGAVYGPARAATALLPPLVFGAGVLSHLLRHRRHYDVMHTARSPTSRCSRPAWRGRSALRPGGRLARGLERDYWRDYLGRLGGRIGTRCSCSARAFLSAHSASRDCTPSVCVRRACAAR